MVSTDSVIESGVAARVMDVLSGSLMEPPSEPVTLATNLVDLVSDSFEIIEVIFALEQEFDVSIPDSAVQEVKTVGDLVDRLEPLIHRGAP